MLHSSRYNIFLFLLQTKFGDGGWEEGKNLVGGGVGEGEGRSVWGVGFYNDIFFSVFFLSDLIILLT